MWAVRLELCGKQSGKGRFVVKRDEVFCNIQWKLLLPLTFYLLLCSRKTNITHCSFLSFIRNGPWGTYTCKLHSSARGSTHSLFLVQNVQQILDSSAPCLHKYTGREVLTAPSCQRLCLLPRVVGHQPPPIRFDRNSSGTWSLTSVSWNIDWTRQKQLGNDSDWQSPTLTHQRDWCPEDIQLSSRGSLAVKVDDDTDLQKALNFSFSSCFSKALLPPGTAAQSTSP